MFKTLKVMVCGHVSVEGRNKNVRYVLLDLKMR